MSRDYSAAEFEQLTEQQRSNMGLRTFALERLLPPVLPQQEKTALRSIISALPIKMNRKPYISWIVKFPQTELLGYWE